MAANNPAPSLGSICVRRPDKMLLNFVPVHPFDNLHYFRDFGPKVQNIVHDAEFLETE